MEKMLTEISGDAQVWWHIDKQSWERGEWDYEPDKAQWVDDLSGLDCLIVRGPYGALCGYVGVPEPHPYFGVDWQVPDVSVHGGVTFCDRCRPTVGEHSGICHAGDSIANKEVWWIGFDCAHAYDIQPGFPPELRIFIFGEYRSFDYVRRQVASLAKQLIAVENNKQ